MLQVEDGADLPHITMVDLEGVKPYVVDRGEEVLEGFVGLAKELTKNEKRVPQQFRTGRNGRSFAQEDLELADESYNMVREEEYGDENTLSGLWNLLGASIDRLALNMKDDEIAELLHCKLNTPKMSEDNVEKVLKDGGMIIQVQEETTKAKDETKGDMGEDGLQDEFNERGLHSRLHSLSPIKPFKGLARFNPS
jgi:hypothetical protein